MAPKKYVTMLLLLVVSCLLGVTAFTVYADPYWLWRDRPVWVEYDNLALLRKMRFSKALQVVRRQPEVVFIGSSRVQVGIDPADARGVVAYNLGIESLRAFEMRAYVEHVVRWTPTKQLVIGLDFLSFLDRDPPYLEGFDLSLGNYQFFFNNVTTSLISYTAVEDSITALTSRGQDATWTNMGYTNISGRSRRFAEQLMQYMQNTTYAPPFSIDTLEYLEAILIMADAHDVIVTLYFSPIHQEQFQVIEEAGKREAYDAWRAQVVALAGSYQVPLWDFTNNNPYMESDLSGGSNEFYFDPSHYTPTIGALMMREMGFAIVEDVTLPADSFGTRVR